MKKLKLPNIKGIFKVKNKLRASLIGTLMLITVGYAGLNSTLGIEGLISILQNADFNVFFSKTIVDGIEKLSLIDPSGQSITFTSSDISTENDSVVDYTITNGSSQYNAEVSISCSPEINDGIKLEYSKDKTLIEANSSFNGSITSKIVDGETTSTDRLERLIDVIRKQSKGSDVANNIDYNKISSNTNGNGVYTTNNTDSGKNVYFYRGNVNNNVVFADKCWKMVRTTETDGVKLIYSGDYVNGKCGQGSPIIENTFFNGSNNDDNAYVGYMYGTTASSTYEETHKNTNDSVLKIIIDKWYEKNLLNTAYENYIEDTTYCNDRSIVTDFSNLSLSSNSYTSFGYAREMTLYGYGARGGEHVKQITPTLKCKNVNDRFSISNEIGNGALKYPIAAITADEVVLAGARAGRKTESMGTTPQNMDFYLYSSTSSWTMTPFQNACDEFSCSRVFCLYLGGFNDFEPRHGDIAARPVISVKGDTRVRVGDGTTSNPYILESDKYNKFTCQINIEKVENYTGGEQGGHQKLYDRVVKESLGTDTKNNIDYNKISSDTNGKGVYETSDTDTGKPVYFYRGDVENNNVVFADKCWKIVRTTETNGTKIIYNGEKTADETCENTGAAASLEATAWNTAKGDNAQIGYVYGQVGATNYTAAHQNKNDSTVKAKIDKWWEDNIKGTDYEKLVEDTVYCNDREILDTFTNATKMWGLTYEKGPGYGTGNTFYSGLARVSANAITTKPTLKCQQANDKLTVANKSLRYPVAMITADEAVYAGTTGGVNNSDKGNAAKNYNFFLHPGDKNLWTLTPLRNTNGSGIVQVISSDGSISNEVISNSVYVKPVLSLVNSVKILRGIGTERNPYIVGEVTEQEKPTSKVPDAWQDNGMFSSYYNQAYDKLQTMTLDEKIGQLLVVRYVEKTATDAINNYHVGGFTFYKVDFDNKTKDQVINMTSSLQNQAKIPLLLAADEEGGTVVRVSSNPNLASEPFKSPKEVYDSGGLAAIKKDTINKSAMLNELGINLNYAPVVDIASPGSYIYKRTLGQDTETTSDFASTVIKASKSSGVSYTLKHFPGYGNNADTHTSSSVDETSVDELWNKHLLPFAAGVNAGAESVMTSHNIVSAVDKENPSSLSKKVHDILINDLKFTGIIITDDLDMDATKNVDNKYVKTIQAGSNIILHGDYKAAHNEIKTAVTNGTLTEDEVSRMAFKVLAWKYFKGILKD